MMQLLISLLPCLCLIIRPANAFLLAKSNERISLSLAATKIIPVQPLLPIEGSSSQETTAKSLEIVYTTDLDTIETWITDHASSTSILGIDTESIPRAPWLAYGREPPNEKEGPATLQLSTLDSCLLVHLAHAPRSIPALQDLLQNSSILKAGVGIDDDALELYRSSF